MYVLTCVYNLMAVSCALRRQALGEEIDRIRKKKRREASDLVL